MENLVFLIIMIPCAAAFTGLGVFAMRRKKPMWFWSGSEVKPYEIRDIPAYNRANGWMWILYSLGFWAAAALSLLNVPAAGVLVAVWCLGGIPVLVLGYNRIYKKYKA
ncbi:MAG: hypothetical protein IJI85_07425 [Clostridia bacterium]|nr:hypothetical protein [Clostridia bacterium]MBR0422395.1 hypothetical protein [Clostridia bacterium]